MTPDERAAKVAAAAIARGDLAWNSRSTVDAIAAEIRSAEQAAIAAERAGCLADVLAVQAALEEEQEQQAALNGNDHWWPKSTALQVSGARRAADAVRGRSK